MLGDVQKALHHGRAAGGQRLFKPVDRGIATTPGARLDEVADSHDDDVLEVRPVEHTDDARPRQLPLDAPEEVVSELLARRSLERVDRDTLRVDLANDVTQRATLARGVHALQNKQQPAGATRLALGEEPF